MYCTPTRFFGKAASSEIVLSVVVPIGQMVGQLENLLSWISHIQDYPAQVILVVDEKGDGTYSELIQALEHKSINQPLIVVNAVCNGPGLARNLGAREATGKWITYWDSDDKPNVKETFNAIRVSQKNVETIICRYEVISHLGKVSSPKLSRTQIALNPGIWRFIFMRELFLESEFPNLRLAEDQVFLIQSRVFSKQIAFHDKVTYRYIQGGANQLTKAKSNLSDLLEAIDMLSNLNRNQANAVGQKTYIVVMVLRLSLTSLKNNPIKTIQHFVANPKILTTLIQSLPFILIERLTK